MPKSFIRFRRRRLPGFWIGGAAAAFGWFRAVAAPAPVPPVPPELPESVAKAALAYRLSMSCLAGGITLALLALIWHLRKRARHPLPEPESVASVLSAAEPFDDSGSEAAWERPPDWWRRGT